MKQAAHHRVIIFQPPTQYFRCHRTAKSDHLKCDRFHSKEAFRLPFFHSSLPLLLRRSEQDEYADCNLWILLCLYQPLPRWKRHKKIKSLDGRKMSGAFRAASSSVHFQGYSRRPHPDPHEHSLMAFIFALLNFIIHPVQSRRWADKFIFLFRFVFLCFASAFDFQHRRWDDERISERCGGMETLIFLVRKFLLSWS